MRFLMITTFYPPYSFGGDGVFVRALSRALVAEGHTVDVIHCVDSYRAMAGKLPEKKIAVDGVTVHSLRSPFRILSPLATQQTGRPYFKITDINDVLEHNAFDVIHFHNVSLVGGPALLKMGKAVKLYTLHEHWLLCPMHTLFRNNQELCESKTCIACSLRYHRPPQLWRYTNLLYDSVPHIDAFLSPTEFTRKLHMDSGLLMRIRVLPNFHQGSTVKYSKETEPFFLYAGRLERLKGVADLIEAFRGSPHQLWIAGEGNEESALRRQAAGLENIRFLGQLDAPKLAPLFAKATALLVSSLAYEVFPLVILEAFAESTPVIARNRGSLAEVVQQSGGGLLFDDVPGLRKALDTLAADRAQRDELGEAGNRAWKQRWTMEEHLRQYLGIVEELRAVK
jgi:glycosyltransferase involved in cell wall biosynthesis